MKIVDSSGNELGYQQGSDYVINNRSGVRLGWINALNDIIDTYGTKVGEIRSNGVFNVYGSRVGDVTGDNIIGLLTSDTQDPPPPPRSEDRGFLASIFFFFVSFFRKRSFAGKIGAIVGFVAMVAISFAEQPGNALFFGPIGLFLGAGIGTFIGFFYRKLSRTGRFGALIGAGVLGISLGVMGLVGTNVSTTIIFIIVGIFIGGLIGNLVGYIRKK